MKLPALLAQFIFGAWLLCFGQGLQAQTTLYSEDFSGQYFQGITGQFATANQVFNSANGKWSVIAGPNGGTNLGIQDTNDWARVEDDVVGFSSTSLPSGFAFQFRDVDEPTTWKSQVVDISNYTSASLSLQVFEVGLLEANDFIELAYILDGTRNVINTFIANYSDTNGQGSSSATAPGNTNPIVVSSSVSGLSGSTLQIEVIADCNSGSEIHHLDNVVIQGFGFNPPVCTFQFGSNSGVCDAFTAGNDTYTATFNYSGAGNGDYTVTSNIGTVVLNNDPDNVAAGFFTVTGIPEGINAAVTLDGVNCTNVSDTVTAPTCPAPVCTFQFGSNSGVCDATTAAVDNYTATFNFSGAGNGDYTVTSNAGTVVLDNDPDNVAAGSFRVVGVPEGTDVTATVNGVNCTNITSTVSSPSCGVPPPGNLTLISLSLPTQLFPEMTWTAASGADEYTIQLSIGGGAFQDRATVSNTTLAFTDTLAVFGQSLTYRIKASNTSGSTLSNSLSLTPPATVERLVLSYNCFDAANNELVWDVQNPNIQNTPFIWAQWWSPQRDTLIAPNQSTSNFRTLLNSQDPNTFGDDNITGIWWIDETLQAGEPNDIVFAINLNNTCAAGRVSNPAQQAPLWMGKAIGNFMQLPTNIHAAGLDAYLTVGPNPFTDVIYIEASELRGEAAVKVFDMAGREVYKGQINLNYRSEIQLPELQLGVYLLQLGADNVAHRVKIVKQ